MRVIVAACLVLAAVPFREIPGDTPQQEPIRSVVGKWNGSDAQAYEIKAIGEGRFLLKSDDPSYNACGSFDGKFLYIQWDWAPLDDSYRQVGRLEWADGKLIGVYANSNQVTFGEDGSIYSKEGKRLPAFEMRREKD